MQTIRTLYANPWARALLTVLLLGVLILKVQPERVGHALSAVDPKYLFIALLLTVPFLALKSARWYLMLRAARVDATPHEAAVSLIGGMGLALVTPGRVGELVRLAYLRDPQKWKIGGLVMLDKGFDVLVLAALSIVGAWHLLGVSAGLAFIVVTLVGLAVVFEPRPLSGLLHRVSAPLPMAAKLNAIWSSLESLSPRATADFLLLTLLSFIVVLVQFGIILLSWRASSPEIVLFTFPLVVLTNVLPITVGGLGVREAAAAVLLGHYGVPAADAALAAFLMFLLNTALPGLAGALLLPAAVQRPVARSIERR